MKRLNWDQHQRLSDIISFGPIEKRVTDQELIDLELIEEKNGKVVFKSDPYEIYLNENDTIKDEWLPEEFIGWRKEKLGK